MKKNAVFATIPLKRIKNFRIVIERRFTKKLINQYRKVAIKVVNKCL